MKRAASAFLRFADLAANAGVVVAAVSLGLIALLLFAEILTRLVSGGTLGDTWEFATYFMALTFLLGAAYTLRTGGHVRVSLLHFTNPKRDAVVEGAACVFGLALSIFIAYALTDLAWQSYVRGIRSPTPSQLPLYLPASLSLSERGSLHFK